MRTRIPVRRLMLVLAFCGCRPGVGANQGNDRVRHALLAQVEGLGGCTDVEVHGESTSPQFPHLRLIRGTCTKEHGQAGFALVALDESGRLYLLDSPSGFNFLVREHRPANVDSSSALGYVMTVLEMMGRLSPADTLVRTPTEVPATVLAEYGLTPGQWQGSGVIQSLRGGYVVSVTTLGPERVTAHHAVVDPGTGSVRLTLEMQWSRQPPGAQR